MEYFNQILLPYTVIQGFAEHQSSRLWSFSENARVKDGHICDENQYLFQGKLLSYSVIFSYYFESKSDI